ncbi:hypothetical protein ACFQUU_19480 [Herbaspirillum sp. GCM10030257]|uniref:hypothetical protein n=1 Tax=Herbaspirillum sp. GCM10030257 TaxID=3273393 RepID=UPI00360FD5CB
MNNIWSAAASSIGCCFPTDNRSEGTESPSNNPTSPTGRQRASYPDLRYPDAAPTVSNATPAAEDSPQLRTPLRRGSTASLMEGFLRTAHGRAAKHISRSLDTEIPPAKKQPYVPLSLNELETLLTGEEIGALKKYIQDGGGLSEAMRHDRSLTSEQAKMLTHIQSALAKIRERGGSYPGLLHRGMTAGINSHDNSHVKLFTEGKKFKELGLMSTSSDSAFVNSWHDGIKLTVAAPKNGDISSLNRDQMEVLCEPATYDVLLTAFDRKGVFRVLISEEGVPPESGKATHFHRNYEDHLIRPAYELHRKTDFLSGEIPSDRESQRRHLIMHLTLGFNSILKVNKFPPMYRSFFPPGYAGHAHPGMQKLRQILNGEVTYETPVKVAAVFEPFFETEKMKALLKLLDDELRHLKDAHGPIDRSSDR